MRLQKYLSNNGVCSRRKAEKYISEGRVSVNGEVITTMGFIVSTEDEIKIDGSLVNIITERVYLVLNKPINTITSLKDHRNRPLVTDHIPEFNMHVYPVGRLDFNTSGVLLFTNDGNLNNKLLHPSFKIIKKYAVTLNTKFATSHTQKLEKGIIIDGKVTAPAKLKIIKNNLKGAVLHLQIYEGRKHQVKKMFKALGYKVTNLHRMQFANINDKNLDVGESRFLTKKEIQELKRLTEN